MAMTTRLVHELDPLVLLPPPFSLPRRLLRLQASTTEATSSPADPTAVNSNAFLILVALLCALICVVGLALVARCAWLRRAVVAATAPRPKAPTNKGLKKKAIRALPKLAFSPAHRATLPFSDCPICLSDFAEGDQVRVLPRCAHAFHAPCIDTWLAAHSSCPSCRRNLADATSVPKGTARPQPAQAGAASGTTVSVPSVATSTCAGKFEGCGEASCTVEVDGKEQGPKVLVID